MAFQKKSLNNSRKLKISVTGASGFVGKKLIQNLLKEGHSIKVLTRKKNRIFPKGIEVIKGDLSSPTSDLDNFLSGCDVLFNCAGEINNTHLMEKTHINGTKNLLKTILDLASSSGKRIHWVQLSSVGVYGKVLSHPNKKRRVNEQSKINPQGIYEITKAESDKLIILAAEDGYFTFSILRPSTIIGLGMPNKSFGRLIKNILGYNFFYIGYKNTISNYVHVDDVVEALMLCGKKEKAINQIFNLSNDCKLSSIVKNIRNEIGKSVKILSIPEGLIRLIIFFIPPFFHFPLNTRVVDVLVSRTYFDTVKISNVLKFKPKVFIPKFSVDYMRAHFNKCKI